MKLMSTLTILAAALSLGTLKATPAHADDSNDPATMQISPADSRPAGAGPAEKFTGDVTVKPLFDPNGVRTFGSAEVSFTPCARTAWHTHPGGQTLIVTTGEAGSNSGAARSRPSIPVMSSGPHRASSIGTAPPRPRP